MYLSDPTKFAHRRNSDGSFDSICLKCFVNVDHGNEEEDLDLAEYIHVCDLEILSPRQSVSQRTLQTAA
jgi:hypothetical protein